MISLVEFETVYKWKNNKDYMKEYTKENHYYCQVCRAKVCFLGKAKHLKTEKHNRNLKGSCISPDLILLRLKNGEVVSH
jgi:hypothetical protein